MLVNTALRTVIAEGKVNAAAYSIHVPQMAVVNVNQIMTAVVGTCIVASTDISGTIMCVDIAASERHAIAIQTVAHRTNIVSPGKYVGHLDFTVRKTLTAREMESAVKLVCVLLHVPGPALRPIIAGSGSVANIASVVQAVMEIIARLITIAEGRPTVVNVET